MSAESVIGEPVGRLSPRPPRSRTCSIGRGSGSRARRSAWLEVTRHAGCARHPAPRIGYRRARGRARLQRRLDLVALRIGGEARRNAHVVGVDGRERMPGEGRPDEADDGHDDQIDGADRRGLVGAESAATHRPRAIGPPGREPRGSAASVIAHPRIDNRVEQVDDQVEGDDEDRDHHDGAHDERVVAVQARHRRSSGQRRGSRKSSRR